MTVLRSISIARNAAVADKSISSLLKRVYHTTSINTSDIKYAGMGYGIVHSQHLASEGAESEHLFRHVASPRTVSVIGCVRVMLMCLEKKERNRLYRV